MKIVLQDGIKDCGICCLLSIIRYYGGNVSKEYLKDVSNTTKNGVTAYNLILAAEKIGLHAIGVKGDMNKIEKNNLPCLAHLTLKKGYKHFVVIYEIDKEKEKVLIMDPAKGKKTLSFSAFKLLSTNNYIFLNPIKPLPEIKIKKKIQKNINYVLVKNKNLLFKIIILTVLFFILNVVVAYDFKYILTFIIDYNVMTNMTTILIILISSNILLILNKNLKNTYTFKLSSILDEELTLVTLDQIFSLPYLYYKNRTTGEVTSRLKDLTIVKSFILNLFNTFIPSFISGIIFLILMFETNFKLTCYVILYTTIEIVFLFIMKDVEKLNYKKIRRKEEKVNSYLIESLSNADTLKGTHIEKKQLDSFNKLYKELLEKNYKYGKLCNYIESFNEINKQALLLIVNVLGCLYIVKNKEDIFMIFLFQNLMLYFLNDLKNILEIINEYQNYKISLERIEDLFLIQKENFENSLYYYNYSLIGNIKFNNLSFQYGYKKIFDNISFEIKAKEKVLLIGTSGSGKSTLMKILNRYIEIPSGKCKINGIDVNHYHLEIIRKKISYVSSNEFLFTDSIYNNLTMGKNISKNEINKIIRLTKIDEILKSRKISLDLVIEENGFNFSSGERQRIILGRYLLRNSDIYIFDEALSQLDVMKEKKIIKNIINYLNDKTIIMISHHIICPKYFNKILEIKDGKINEKTI